MSDSEMLGEGVRAPEFAATAGDGARYELANLLARGDVALFFYPGNNTPG